MTERDLIEQIRQLAGHERAGLVQGIGDDCAVIDKDGRNVSLLTMDTLIESVHFDCSWHPPFLLGRKAVSVNVSDIAAMGGQALFALLSLALPADFSPEWLRELNRGIHAACSQYGCLLIGGDTVRSPDKVSLTLTLIGETDREQVLYRHKAAAGDTVWVSGVLGYAAAGLDYFRAGKGRGTPCSYGTSSQYPPAIAPCVKAHLDPEARTGLGCALARIGCVHAMMDLSDGLATDLSHLCQQSRTAALIEADKLPGRQGLAAAAAAASLLNRKPLDWMIAGGEDYELLFTAAPEDSQVILAAAEEQGVAVTAVGRIRKGRGRGQGVVLRRKTGQGYEEQPVSFQGFDHFTKE